MSRRIIFFHPCFLDGGVERTNIGLAKGLIDNGYSITFLTTRYTKHFIEEINMLGIDLVSLGDMAVSKSLFPLVKFLNNISKHEKIIFISCQYYVNVISMIASLFVKNRKNIVFINSERNHINDLKLKHSIKDFFILCLVKILYRFADKIVANSEETTSDLSNFLKLPVECLYNPTINERINELQNEPIFEDWFNNDNRKVILSIGRLCFQKDFDTLIRAFDIFGKFDEYRLIILGEGNDRYRLERLIKELKLKDHVFLPGFVCNPYKFLKTADIFILSSKCEGLPNVLIEALYLKIPSISTRCKSGPSEILLNDDLLVDVGNFEIMAKKIDFVLSHPCRHILFKKAFENLNRFEFDNSVNKFLEAIK
ncbi:MULTISPECIES: glycosyltransferase [Campylobacter]|uniref:glycosyltransferase n=2 Tax=Campylobacteraceae TaxID=72294 RepID=UPI001470745D|nr:MULTISPECIES: glycosyltransferase [Campylobacter]MDU6827437.1 glycosyltransferase [Campylobacter sp.]